MTVKNGSSRDTDLDSVLLGDEYGEDSHKTSDTMCGKGK